MTMPKHFNIIDDQTEAKALLIRHDQLTGLAPRPGSRRAFVMWRDQKSIYIGMHFWDMADPGSNGYQVVILSRKHYSASEAMHVFQHVTGYDSGVRPQHFAWVDPDRQNRN